MNDKIWILEVAPLVQPRLVEIDHGFKSLERIVGGRLQFVLPWNDPVMLICDEEGMLKKYPPNRILEDDNGIPYDIIMGTFCIVEDDDEGLVSITDDLAEKYTRKFQYPEAFWKVAGRTMMQRLGSDEGPRMLSGERH